MVPDAGWGRVLEVRLGKVFPKMANLGLSIGCSDPNMFVMALDQKKEFKMSS